MLEKYIEVINNTPLFSGIKNQNINSMLACLNSKIKKYDKNNLIFISEDNISSVGIILSGQAQIIKEDIMGNKTIITNLESGDIFGETFACAQITKIPVTILAVSSCSIMFIDYKKIITTCSSSCSFHNVLIKNMLKIIASKNILLNQKLNILSKRTIREKLMCYFLYEINYKKNKKFTISFSRHELADYLCIDRSAMSRELCKMRDEGLIIFDKNTFEILI